MTRIKLNIEIELEGKDAKKFIKKVEKLSDAITGSATVSDKPKKLSNPTTKKAKPVKAAKAPKAVKGPKKTEPKKSAIISDADFIDAWQNSEGTLEVAEKTGITRDAARKRAHVLKKNGVPLKKFKAGRRKSN